MSDDQFTKLFTYIEAFRSDVEKQFEEVKRDQADIRAAIGALVHDFADSWKALKIK